MPTIDNIQGIPTGLQPTLRRVRSLQLAESALGSGTFGEVYPCVGIDGIPSPEPLVVKVLRDHGKLRAGQEMGSVRKLQDRIVECNRRRAAAGRPPIESLPALCALPKLSFLGSMNGREVLGYLSARLDTAGYVQFASILHDDSLAEEYYALDFEDRFMLAAELAEGFHALASELTFIHADLNPPNLFVNIATRRIAIIDYDGGAVMDGPDDRPETLGKLGQWLAPEVEEELAKSGPHGAIVNVNLFTDAWAVFMCIHNLLFPAEPFFFARYATHTAIGGYLATHRWPAADFTDPFCDPEKAPSYLFYRKYFDALPGPLRAKIEATVNRGYLRPDLRPSSEEWEIVLRHVIAPPRVVFFGAEPESIVAGMSTVLSWQVRGAREVTLDGGIGVVESAASREVRPGAHCRYTLTVRGRNGDVVRRTVSVMVWPVPIVRSLAVPTLHFAALATIKALPVTVPDLHFATGVDLAIRVEPLASPAAGGRDMVAPPHLALPRPPGYRAGAFSDMFRELSEELRAQLMGDPS